MFTVGTKIIPNASEHAKQQQQFNVARALNIMRREEKNTHTHNRTPNGLCASFFWSFACMRSCVASTSYNGKTNLKQ